MNEFNAFVAGERTRIEGRPGQPLSGRSFVAKDLFDVQAVPTGGGNPDWELEHRSAVKHAWLVERLLSAGASLLGKTVTCEISLGILGINRFHGTPDNPRVPGALPGGSSSGSAAAVAGGIADIGLGTDSGGSIRVPASFCGLYGLRPTHGRVPLGGVVAQSPSFDTAGWLTREIKLFAAVAENVFDQSLAARPRFEALLVARDCFHVAEPRVRDALEDSVQALHKLFGVSEDVSLARGELQRWAEHRAILQRYEIWKTFGPWIERTNPRFAFNVARTLILGSQIDEHQLKNALSVRAQARKRARDLLGAGAILCMPTTPFPAPDLGLDLPSLDRLADRLALLTSFAGLTGVPQLSIPVGGCDGRPIGLSLVGAPNTDLELIGIARVLAAD